MNELAKVYEFPKQPEPPKHTFLQRIKKDSATIVSLAEHKKQKVREFTLFSPDNEPA
jgi:hypothetical protein